MTGRVKCSRTTSSLLLLLAPLVLSSGCFGFFHAMQHRTKMARGIFWTEAVAMGLACTISAGGGEHDMFPGVSGDLFGIAMLCEVYDVWGAILKGHAKDCAACATHVIVTPTGAALVFRF
jgi:hypothetical protein